MTSISAMNNGYNTTLEVCREHIDDATAAIVAVKNILNAFAESYVDVTDTIFNRRSSLSHNAYVNLFNSTIESLQDVSQLLVTARALCTGAQLISDSDSASDSDNNEEVR